MVINPFRENATRRYRRGLFEEAYDNVNHYRMQCNERKLTCYERADIYRRDTPPTV